MGPKRNGRRLNTQHMLRKPGLLVKNPGEPLEEVWMMAMTKMKMIKNLTPKTEKEMLKVVRAEAKIWVTILMKMKKKKRKKKKKSKNPLLQESNLRLQASNPRLQAKNPGHPLRKKTKNQMTQNQRTDRTKVPSL